MTTNEKRIHLERRIVRGMIRWLKREGWQLVAGNDGGGWQSVTREGEAMELVFSVDMSQLRFEKDGARHSVLLVGGNDIDIISDWGFSDGDPDGFDAVMDAVLEWVNTIEEETLNRKRGW
jgi:hypothetical protein